MDNFTWLKVFVSPFKRPKLIWHFGKKAVGTPYFYPRKWVKFTHEDIVEAANKAIDNPQWIKKSFNEWYQHYRNYSKPVPLKIGFSFCSLGWKTKWDSTDYRHEWNPTFSFVFFDWQIALRIVPIDDYKYWTCWLYYEYNTDKSKSKKERVAQCRQEFPSTWMVSDSESGKNARRVVDYYDLILKKKYL